MRVLVVHNRYRSENPSGENAVVDLEVDLLRGAGVDVTVFERSSDEIDDFSHRERASLAVQPIYSAASVRRVRTIVREFKPDVLHLHNPYPLISPAVLRVARTAGVATVVTVHNYRLVCANGLFFRDGHDCHDCQHSRLPYPAVVHACYRDSRPQSAVLATSLVAHRGTWKSVDRFVALSPPIHAFLRAYGIPAERIALKPNSVRDPGPSDAPGSGFLFASRLSAEKGIELLIDAWSRHAVGSLGPLRICGDGPMRHRLESWAQARDDVEFLGYVSPDDVAELMRASAVVIVAPIWDETCPMTAIEAMAHGRPVLGTSRGGLPYLLGAAGGWIVHDDPASFAAGLAVAAKALPVDDWAGRARARYVEVFSPERVTRDLLAIYEAAVRARS